MIAGKLSSAVLISSEDWQAIQETSHLLSIPGMFKSIRDAIAKPLDTSVRELSWCLGSWSIQSKRSKTQEADGRWAQAKSCGIAGDVPGRFVSEGAALSEACW